MSWICPKCETENPDRLKVCEVCNSPRMISRFEKLKEKYSDAAYKSFIRYHYSLLELADNNDTSAQYKVGEWFYTHGSVGVSDCYRKIAVIWYKKAALKGHIEAQFKLALCYEEGSGVYCDKDEAIKWYKKAVDQGSHYALTNYLKLKYSYKSYEQVIKYRKELLLAADGGNVRSQYALGEWFNNDNNQSAYREEAFVWYSKAANEGYIPARKKLAESYLYGKLVSKNVTQALYWYDMAWEDISAIDLYNIGYAYDTGDTVFIDKTKAVKYYRMAAEKGYSTAQHKLGVCYEKGTGVEKDINAAKYWYEKSSAQGHEESKRRLSSIEFEIYSKDQEKKGCLTYLVTGIISLITLIILTNQPDNSWVHNKPFFDYEIGTALWIGSIFLVYYISRSIIGYDD